MHAEWRSALGSVPLVYACGGSLIGRNIEGILIISGGRFSSCSCFNNTKRGATFGRTSTATSIRPIRRPSPLPLGRPQTSAALTGPRLFCLSCSVSQTIQLHRPGKSVSPTLGSRIFWKQLRSGHRFDNNDSQTFMIKSTGAVVKLLVHLAHGAKGRPGPTSSFRSSLSPSFLLVSLFLLGFTASGKHNPFHHWEDKTRCRPPPACQE
jgi:hypothetical protein